MTAFFVLLGGLAFQMRQGGDPSLGVGTAIAQKQHRVVVRRVVRRTVITHEGPAPQSTPSTDGSTGSAGSSPPPAPASSPPATPAPAPAAAPPPAPAPAPVTRSS